MWSESRREKGEKKNERRLLLEKWPKVRLRELVLTQFPTHFLRGWSGGDTRHLCCTTANSRVLDTWERREMSLPSDLGFKRELIFVRRRLQIRDRMKERRDIFCSIFDFVSNDL